MEYARINRNCFNCIEYQNFWGQEADKSISSAKTDTLGKVEKGAENHVLDSLGYSTYPLKQPKNETNGEKMAKNKKPTYCKSVGCIKFALIDSDYCEEHTIKKHLPVGRKINEEKSQYLKRRRIEQLNHALKSGYLFGKPVIEVFYGRYKHGAEKRGVGFNLSLDQFGDYWQKDCHYCGTGISTIGLDRVDNGSGYEEGNVVPCCTECNKMKRAMQVEDFISQCIKIAENAKVLA